MICARGDCSRPVLEYGRAYCDVHRDWLYEEWKRQNDKDAQRARRENAAIAAFFTVALGAYFIFI
jgi:hypothetical protein